MIRRPSSSYGISTMLATLLLGVLVTASGHAQTEEVGAVKKTLENYSDAVSAKNLNLLLSFIADDAQIDSRAAGKMVNKQEFGEAMARALRNIDGVQVRNLKVTLLGPNDAVVDGESYIRAGGQMTGAYRQWKLRKREGKWLIVESKDK